MILIAQSMLLGMQIHMFRTDKFHPMLIFINIAWVASAAMLLRRSILDDEVTVNIVDHKHSTFQCRQGSVIIDAEIIEDDK